MVSGQKVERGSAWTYEWSEDYKVQISQEDREYE